MQGHVKQHRKTLLCSHYKAELDILTVMNVLRVLLRLFLHLKLFIASDRISQNIMIGLTCLSHILCRSDALLDSTSQISAVKNIFHPRAKNLTLRVLHFFCYVCYQSDKLSITLAKIEIFKN